MPLFLPDVIGHNRAEAKDHVELALAGVHTEAVAQPLLQRKFLRALENLSGGFDGLNSGRKERPDVFAR